MPDLGAKVKRVDGQTTELSGARSQRTEPKTTNALDRRCREGR